LNAFERLHLFDQKYIKNSEILLPFKMTYYFSINISYIINVENSCAA